MDDLQSQVSKYYQYAEFDEEPYKIRRTILEERENLKLDVVIVTDSRHEYLQKPFKKCYDHIAPLNEGEFTLFLKEMQMILDHELVAVLTQELKEVERKVLAGSNSEQYRQSDWSESIMFVCKKPLHHSEIGIRHTKLAAVKSVLDDLARRSEPRRIWDADFFELEQHDPRKAGSWIVAVQLMINYYLRTGQEIEAEPLPQVHRPQIPSLYQRTVELNQRLAEIRSSQRSLLNKYKNNTNAELSLSDRNALRAEISRIEEMVIKTQPSINYIKNNLKPEDYGDNPLQQHVTSQMIQNMLNNGQEVLKNAQMINKYFSESSN